MAKKKRYYQRPDGIFETTRTVNGKRVRFRGKTCAEVDRKILAYNEEKKRGRKMPAIIDEWQEQHDKEVEESTRRVYSVAVKRIREEFLDYAGKYTPKDLQRYITAFAKQGYSASTVRVELAVLKQVFAHAVLCGDIAVSPATEVKIGKGLPKQERRALTEEQEALVEQYRGEDYLLGLMLLYTGCRRGELLALTWQDIDREAGVIHVTKKVNYATGKPVLEHRLKSSNGKRDIPILAPLAAVLPKAPHIGLIFGDDDGGHMIPSRWRKRWTSYAARVGIDDVTPHQFRHSFATLLYEAGVDIKVGAAYLGDTEQVVQGVYEELRATRAATGAERLNAYLEMRQAEAAEKHG